MLVVLLVGRQIVSGYGSAIDRLTQGLDGLPRQ
jgi:hypothetical protein